MTHFLGFALAPTLVQTSAKLLPWIIGVGIVTQFVGVACFLAFYFRPKPGAPGVLKGVTIIKPCFKNDDHEDENFRAYFCQDYAGPLELIFTVSNENDPIVPVVKSYLRQYPQVDAKLIISQTRRAYWRKIDAYYDAYQVARHDQVIISDSDSKIKTDYLSQMVAFLNEPGVSFVTTPQYDTGANNFATALKTIGNNADVAVYAMIIDAIITRKKMAWGHSIAFRKSEFDEFGDSAWARLSDYFGDDLILPTLFTERGKKVVFRNVFCPVQFSDKTLSQMLDQQRRFAICQKVAVGPWVHVLGLLLIPQVMAALYIFTSRLSAQSLYLFLAVWASRLLVSLIFEGLTFKTVRNTLVYFWTIPIWDLLKIYFVFCALGRNRVYYHGHIYHLTQYARLKEDVEASVNYKFNRNLVVPTYENVRNKPETRVKR